MGTKPRACKADPEPLYSVGDCVYTYDNIKRDPVKWTVKSRETIYQDDRLAGASYTLEHYNEQGQADGTMLNVHPNEIYDSAEEVIQVHFDDMRQIIESCAVEIKGASDTMLRWMRQYSKAFGKGDNR